MDIFIDTNEIRQLMNDFYLLTQIKIVLFDMNFNTVVAVPEEESLICSAVKNNTQGKLKCDKCTVDASRFCNINDGVNIYKCHLGLYEAVKPLKINDVIVGYIMFGQILDSEYKDDNICEVLSNLKQYYDGDGRALLESHTAKSQDEIHAAAKIMETCIAYILMKKLIREEKVGLSFKIAAYIEENLSRNFSAEDLCKAFNISRNTLYRIFSKHFGVPTAEYIRKKRIVKAYEMLMDGKSIKETATSLGFSDYSYFTKVFKNELGIVPSKVLKKKFIQGEYDE